MPVIVYKDIHQFDKEVFNFIKENSDVKFKKFPKIIHQIWFNENPNLPEYWKDSPQKWITKHPDWLYILWNEKMGYDFIKNFEPEFYATYTNYPLLIQRCDAIRYCFLKRYGGLYSDLDISPLENLEDHFTDDCSLYFAFYRNAQKLSMINNCFIASKVNVGFWDLLLDKMKNVKLEWYAILEAQKVGYTTSFYILTETLSESLDSICILPMKKFAPLTSREIEEGKTKTNDSVIEFSKGLSWANNFTRALIHTTQNADVSSLIISLTIGWLIAVILAILLIFILYKYVYNQNSVKACTDTTLLKKSVSLHELKI